MGMVVQHNLPAINSHRQLGINNNSLSKSLEKLSSGFRINRAADDAAGLAISEKMRGQISGLAKASENAQDGISLIQTAEGALQESHSILQRMRELAVQSSNGTYQNEVDRENINKEVQALKDEIDRISTSTHYNGIQLLDGSLQGARVTSTEGSPRDPNLATSATGVSNADINKSVSGATSTLEIDLTNLGGAVTSVAGVTLGVGEISLKIGDTTIQNKTAATAVAAGGSLSTAQILASFTTGGGAGNDEYSINGTTYTASANGNKLVLTAKTAGSAAAAEGALIGGTATITANNAAAAGTGTTTATATSTSTGADFAASKTTISIRDSIKEHTTFGINGKNYEVVDIGSTLKNGTTIQNGMIMDNGNIAIAVKMNGPNVGSQVTQALAANMNRTAAANGTAVIGAVGSWGGDAGTFKNAVAAAGDWTVKANGNTLVIESADNGTGVDFNGQNTMGVNVNGPITSARTTIDMKNVEYGMTVKVGDKNYEVVKNANDVRDDKNIAIVLDNINNFNSNTVAKALFDKVKEDTSINKDFDIKHDGGSSITITEKAPKGDTKAVGVNVGNAGVTFQIGANGKADQKVSLQVDAMDAANLGIKDSYGITGKSIKDINVGTRNTANEAIEVIDAAINQVSSTRADMGALQNRMEHTIKNLDVAGENLTAAESRIRDVDMAKEMMSFSKSQITSQAAQAMLAQANTLPQGVLQLLQ